MQNTNKKRVYLRPGQTAPEGANVQTGRHGGQYYETSEGQGQTEEAPQKEESAETSPEQAPEDGQTIDTNAQEVWNRQLNDRERLQLIEEAGLSRDILSKEYADLTPEDQQKVLNALQPAEPVDAPEQDDQQNKEDTLQRDNKAAQDAILMVKQEPQWSAKDLSTFFEPWHLKRAVELAEEPEVKQKLMEAARISGGQTEEAPTKEQSPSETSAEQEDAADDPYKYAAQWEKEAESEGYEVGTDEADVYMEERRTGGSHQDGLDAIQEAFSETQVMEDEETPESIGRKGSEKYPNSPTDQTGHEEYAVRYDAAKTSLTSGTTVEDIIKELQDDGTSFEDSKYILLDILQDDMDSKEDGSKEWEEIEDLYTYIDQMTEEDLNELYEQ